MNKRVIVYVLGAVLLIEAALMLLPLLVAVIYREKNGWYFLWVLLGAAVLGALALGLGGRKRSASAYVPNVSACDWMLRCSVVSLSAIWEDWEPMSENAVSTCLLIVS